MYVMKRVNFHAMSVNYVDNVGCVCVSGGRGGGGGAVGGVEIVG